MLKHLLTVESFVYLTWRKGIMLFPTLPMDFIIKLSRVNAAALWPIILISPYDQRQEVLARFYQAHYISVSGQNRWATECFLEGPESIQERIEVWCDVPDELIMNTF